MNSIVERLLSGPSNVDCLAAADLILQQAEHIKELENNLRVATETEQRCRKLFDYTTEEWRKDAEQLAPLRHRIEAAERQQDPPVDRMNAYLGHIAAEKVEPVGMVEIHTVRNAVSSGWSEYDILSIKLNIGHRVKEGDLLYTTPQPAPAGMVLVGYLDGRRRFFYADDPLMVQDHVGMVECYASAPKEPT